MAEPHYYDFACCLTTAVPKRATVRLSVDVSEEARLVAKAGDDHGHVRDFITADVRVCS